MDKQVWYVTGVSKGLGLALINRLLREGHRVAAVLAPGAIPAWPGHGAGAENFVGPASPRPSSFVPFGYIGRALARPLLPLEADLADEQSVADSIRKTCEVFGRIDVVVNNAGYGLGAPLAYTITVIQKAMTRLRAQRSGHIINIAPITGVTIGTSRGHAFYAAARQAIVDLSATLADDVRPLGIRVTAVLSEGFHTWPSTGRALPGRPAMPQAWHISVDGRQPGDPGIAAAALLRIATAAEPPALVYLTSNAYRMATRKMTLFGQAIADRQCATSF